jgi:GMP reductase
MDTTGTFEMAVGLYNYKMITCIHKHYSVEDWDKKLKDINDTKNCPEILSYIAISTGTSQTDLEKLDHILSKHNVKFICLDVANGYRYDFCIKVKEIRKKYPNKIIIAGNVVTSVGVKYLLDNGADIVKIGIGNGSVCSTRMKTGIGYPQLSAILECHKITHDNGRYIMSDGGCSGPDDIVKAFGAGGDFVMCGGMFAGHLESGGKVEKDSGGKLYKIFYGMSSETAMDKYSNGVAKYKTSEGLTIRIPYKGPVEKTVLDICGGLRSACTYLNSSNIKELYGNVEFIKVNNIK